MSNIQISKRNFELSKKKIQSLASNAPSIEQLPTLETEGGLFNWFDKKVTGAEMNQITGIINRSFIKSNGEIIKLYGQFKEVYNTFESLDKEYIQGIITAVEAANEASQQALEANEEALAAQNDIKRVIEVLKLSVSKLEKTRDEFLYLKSDFEKIQKYFKANSNGMIELDEAEKMEKKLEEQEKQITLLTTKITKIEKRRQHSIYWIAIGILLLALVRFVLPMIK